METARKPLTIEPTTVPVVLKPVEPFVGTVFCGWFCDPDGTMRPERENLIDVGYSAAFLNVRL